MRDEAQVTNLKSASHGTLLFGRPGGTATRAPKTAQRAGAVPDARRTPLRDERLHDAWRLATENDEWEKSDPKAIYLWFRDQFDDLPRAKVRRQVKYLKAWAALKFALNNGAPSSILLTVLVAEAAKAQLDDPGSLGADDNTLRGILERMVERLDEETEVLNPSSAVMEDRRRGCVDQKGLQPSIVDM